MRRWLQWWETGTAGFIAILAAALASPSMYEHAISEIVTALGFLMAALVPAMVLSATVLRAGGFSVKMLRALANGVDRQLKVFGGLFLYSLLGCVVAISGKLADWKLPEIQIGDFGLKIGKLFPLVLTFILSFLLLRSVVFVAGIRSMLRLTAAVAEDEARIRDQGKTKSEADELATYQLPPNYGVRIDLPHTG